MCGIAGMLAFNDEAKAQLHKISEATYTLRRRGPDDEGLFFHNKCALGHRRLSVIDTSKGAAQPFTDVSNRYTIVFNGEIFNYKQLRKQLETKGIRFVSNSDTEVLLYLYIAEKENCLPLLDGEFAFAVYDKEKEKLFLARDRYGIKPLYYYLDEERIVFASELKALIAFGIPKLLDTASLQTYFHLNYIPSPATIFQKVKKLEAGCFAIVANKKDFQQKRYYTLEANTAAADTIHYNAAKTKLKELLQQSVQNRMIADVPLGTFLSGGIDSSIITAIAAQHTKNLNTFSIGFKDEPLFDETHYASLVAKKYTTNHTVFSLSNNDLYQSLNSLLDSIDEPFADSSALAVNILSQHTRKYVTVALSGDGADELFAGYNKHAAELRVRNNGLKENMLSALHPLLRTMPKSRNTKVGNKIRQAAKFAEGMKLSYQERYWQWARWSGFSADELFSSNVLQNTQLFETRKNVALSQLSHDYNSVLLTDMKMVLENDMLVKVDRMSMNQSLEVRVPFLDHKLVDFAFTLPANYKIVASKRKKILIDTFEDMLPKELLNRGKKGFEVPLLKWFKTELKSMIEADLLNKKFIEEQNIFKYATIQKTVQQLHSSNPNDAVEKIWALLVFQVWWKKYMR